MDCKQSNPCEQRDTPRLEYIRQNPGITFPFTGVQTKNLAAFIFSNKSCLHTKRLAIDSLRPRTSGDHTLKKPSELLKSITKVWHSKNLSCKYKDNDRDSQYSTRFESCTQLPYLYNLQRSSIFTNLIRVKCQKSGSVHILYLYQKIERHPQQVLEKSLGIIILFWELGETSKHECREQGHHMEQGAFRVCDQRKIGQMLNYWDKVCEGLSSRHAKFADSKPS